MKRIEPLAGVALILAGICTGIASVTSVGDARGWGVADAFARESIEPVHRLGMLLGALGIAALVVAMPAVIGRVRNGPGFGPLVTGWIAFAGGATLFVMAFGLAAIAMPALGELALSDGVSPQQIVDGFVRQPPIFLAFLGGNATFLAWVPIGIGLRLSGRFPAWLGWLVSATGVTAWLDFLHVPGFEPYAAPLWPLAVILMGLHMTRARGGAA